MNELLQTLNAMLSPVKVAQYLREEGIAGWFYHIRGEWVSRTPRVCDEHYVDFRIKDGRFV